uniref:Uncharacterized protein n=1 Tax=Arundo donax TaxID=35708 RepID=A0A0A9G9I2_ARUDO
MQSLQTVQLQYRSYYSETDFCYLLSCLWIAYQLWQALMEDNHLMKNLNCLLPFALYWISDLYNFCFHLQLGS